MMAAAVLCAHSALAALQFVELSRSSPGLSAATPYDWSCGSEPDFAAAWPSVSVTLITHGRSHFLPHTLESIAAQDYPAERFEVIIVDDSSDGGEDLWRRLTSSAPGHRLAGRLRYLHAPPDPERGRLGTKRNVAVEAARGEVIAIWDDDDFYAPQRLRRQSAVMAQCAGDIVMLDQSGCEPLLHYFDASSGVFSQVTKSSLAQPCAMAYRRSLWGPGASRYPPGRDVFEDLIFFDSLLAHGARVNVASVPWVRVRHSANMVVDYSDAGARETIVDDDAVVSRVGLSGDTLAFLHGLADSERSNV